MSGNTFGAITWTDGWMDAPMMPRPPRITRCETCRKIHWVASAPLLGYAAPAVPEKGEPWADVPDALLLEEADCYEALREGLGASPEFELELRVLTWWRGNDAFRAPQHPPGHLASAEAVANAKRMIELTSEGDEDLLLFRAEAQRHLGNFDDARQTLDGVGCSDYWPAKSRQLELLDAQNRDLAVLFSPERPPPGVETA